MYRTSAVEIFVQAGAYSEEADGAYQLNVEERPLPADDATSTRNTRGRVVVGGSTTGTLDYPSDTDWFRIALVEGESYRFGLNSEGENALGDPMLRLRNAEGEELVSDDDGGAGLNSYLEFTAPTSGNYFLEAGAFTPEALGSYVLTAAAGDIPNNVTTDASLSADGDYREGVLSPAGDTDWYRIDLTEGQSVRIGLDTSTMASPPLGDPLLVFYGPDGAEISRDDDGGEGLNSWIEYSAATAGAPITSKRAASWKKRKAATPSR
ncbi:MAG: PPC domain-containing protein [Terricaulis sp.]